MGRFQDLPLSDAFMFGEVMRQEKICKLFLEALLQRPIAKIVYASKEETISDELCWHGIRLDVYLRDETDTMYNVEMQATRQDDLLRRTRYYQGMMDRRALEKGGPYTDLPDSYIIFVCDFDHFGGGLAVYQRRQIVEGRADIPYEDGSHVYILNSHYQEGNAQPAILEYLRCIRENNVEEGYESELMRAVCPAIRAVRDDEKKEVSYMTMQMYLEDVKQQARKSALEEGIRQGMQQGRAEGDQGAKRAIVLRMSRRGKPLEEIALDTGLPLEAVREILRAENDG